MMIKIIHIAVLMMFAFGSFVPIQAQTSTSEDTELRRRTDSIVQAVRDYFDEILDVEIGWAALQTRHISNVGYGLDNAIGLNRELRDTIEVIREIVQSEIFVRSLIDYDHFWTRFINREKYSPKEGELGRNVGELYSRELKFDIVFKPAWDTSIEDDVDVARKAGQLAYTCEITVEGEGMFTAEISQSEMQTALNEAVASTTYTKIKSEAAPAVNQGMFTGLLWLAEKFDYVPFKDPSNIERVVFSMPDITALAGYDKYDSKLQGNYETTSIKGKQYPVDWKSVSDKSTNEQVLATVKKKNKNAPVNDTLVFVSSNGTPYTATKQNDTTYLVNVPAASSKEEIALLATYTYADSTGKDVNVTVGQANIAAYVQQPMNLVIVPMIDLPAGITTQSIQTELNKVYEQAATLWSVSKVTSKLVVDGIDASALDDSDSQLLSNYTDGMNTVIDAFKDIEDIDKNTCYLFLAGQGASGTSKCGFMPLKRQFGFIFLNSACSSEAEIHRTIAHELGHGPFRLYHTFSSHNEYTRTQGSTNNLMDYSSAPNPTALNKYQWDLIHDPESMIALFQDEEEGAAKSDLSILLNRFIQDIRYNYAFKADLKFTTKNCRRPYKAYLPGFNKTFFNTYYSLLYIGTDNGELENESLVLKNKDEYEWGGNNVWNNALTFYSSSGKNVRLFYLKSETKGINTDDLEKELHTYLFPDQETWTKSFKSSLEEKDKTIFAYNMASYSVNLYKSLDFANVETVLDSLISKNYTENVFQDEILENYDISPYSSYLCYIVRILLKKNYDLTFADCDKIEDYKSLEDLLAAYNVKTDYKEIDENIFGDLEEGEETAIVADEDNYTKANGSFKTQTGDCTCFCTSKLYTGTNPQSRNYLFNHVVYKSSNDNSAQKNDASEIEVKILANNASGYHGTLTDTYEIVTFEKARLKAGIIELDNQLSEDNPVIIGVSYGAKEGPYNLPALTTDHYMVIVAKGRDSEGIYFRYLDPATSAGGASGRKLYISENLVVSGDCPSYRPDDSYYLVEIRLSSILPSCIVDPDVDDEIKEKRDNY